VSFLHRFKHPVLILVSLAGGAVFGLAFEQAALSLAPLADLYLGFLKIFTLPLAAAAIITGVGRLSGPLEARSHGLKLGAMIFFLLFAAGVLSFFLTRLLDPGSLLSPEEKSGLFAMIPKDPEFGGIPSSEFLSSSRFYYEAKTLIESLSRRVYLFFFQAHPLILIPIFFALGLLSASLPRILKKPLLWFSEKIDKTLKFFYLLMGIFIAPALFFLSAGQAAQTRFTLAFTLLKMLAAVFFVSLIFLLFSEALLSRLLKWKFFQGFKKLKKALLLGAGVDSSFSAVAPAREVLEKEPVLNRNTLSFALPMAAILNSMNQVMIFSVATVFTTRLYDFEWGALSMAGALILCLTAGLAGIGSPILGALPLISLVLGPMGLPYEPTLFLLFSVVFLMEPLASMAAIHSNHALSAYLAFKGKKKK
jgi:Na+/H+-dicarboxylate symporter